MKESGQTDGLMRTKTNTFPKFVYRVPLLIMHTENRPKHVAVNRDKQTLNDRTDGTIVNLVRRLFSKW